MSHFRQNQYQGVNPHLNSFLQNTPGEWESFHTAHIVDLMRSLNQVLPQGYEARVEKSLQIREIVTTDEGTIQKRLAPQPDVTIFDLEHRASTSFTPQAAAVITPVIDTMDIEPELLLNAVVIYQIQANEITGKPITRIELLSPTNKPPAEGYKQYREKRNSTLHSGMPLMEIDYLHQTPPVVKNLKPDHAYYVIVSDPRPSIHQGAVYIYGFDVDTPLCCLHIPLVSGEQLENFDLTVAYNVTFENTATYPRIVNYAEKPLRFETYSPNDQARILAKMAALT